MTRKGKKHMLLEIVDFFCEEEIVEFDSLEALV
jgi:hypothetical protein